MSPRRDRASLKTYHAIQATDLAAAMNDALKKVRIAPLDYAPELLAPQGPSTAGGVQAMQHLRLVAGQEGQPTLVVGHANHAEGKAELRTYEYVGALYLQRFHRTLELDRAGYDAFLVFAQQLFEALHLQTTVVGSPVDLGGDRALLAGRHPRGLPKATVPVVVAAVLVALAAGTWAVFGGR